ncbi:MAG: hypothetical protein LBL83_09280, partial [Clostridiales bacterium]|nr:hypothetical protein [Clostridiales bacterium]
MPFVKYMNLRICGFAASIALSFAMELANAGTGEQVRIPIYPDRHSGFNADSIPEVSGQHSGGIRTAFRRYPDKH